MIQVEEENNKDTIKKNPKKIILLASISIFIVIALLISSNVIGSVMIKETKLDNDQLVSNKHIPVKIENKLYDVEVDILTKESILEGLTHLIIPIKNGTFHFHVDSFYKSDSEIIFFGTKYNFKLREYSYILESSNTLNDPLSEFVNIEQKFYGLENFITISGKSSRAEMKNKGVTRMPYIFQMTLSSQCPTGLQNVFIFKKGSNSLNPNGDCLPLEKVENVDELCVCVLPVSYGNVCDIYFTRAHYGPCSSRCAWNSTNNYNTTSNGLVIRLPKNLKNISIKPGYGSNAALSVLSYQEPTCTVGGTYKRSSPIVGFTSYPNSLRYYIYVNIPDETQITTCPC